MTDDLSANPALLPAGLRDLLPPDAETEAAAVETLMDVFAGHGYQRVKPPLLEFEASLLSGSGAAIAEQTFRLMDPDSQRMMGPRADTTPQVARIATTRLINAPRPLRLSYAGQCLRVRGSELAPDRQIAQAGIELIGQDSPEADAEIVLVAAEALDSVGLTRVSFDLTLPTLVPTLMDDAGIAGAQRGALVRQLLLLARQRLERQPHLALHRKHLFRQHVVVAVPQRPRRLGADEGVLDRGDVLAELRRLLDQDLEERRRTDIALGPDGGDRVELQLGVADAARHQIGRASCRERV